MFVIPMAGSSSRFFEAGFSLPKYQLLIGNETVFEWSIKSFEKYFKTDKFVFIYRDIFQTDSFIRVKLEELGIQNFDLICLSGETEGQADTVYEGLKGLEINDSIYIFNIDSKIKQFTKPDWRGECTGYLEVFKGKGDHWSFVLADNDDNVIQTSEKERISDLCSNGLYFFDQLSTFNALVSDAKQNKRTIKNEYYIAPLYNSLIQEGKTVRYNLINEEDMLFCGTPTEYQQIINNM